MVYNNKENWIEKINIRSDHKLTEIKDNENTIVFGSVGSGKNFLSVSLLKKSNIKNVFVFGFQKSLSGIKTTTHFDHNLISNSQDIYNYILKNKVEAVYIEEMTFLNSNPDKKKVNNLFWQYFFRNMRKEGIPIVVNSQILRQNGHDKTFNEECIPEDISLLLPYINKAYLIDNHS